MNKPRKPSRPLAHLLPPDIHERQMERPGIILTLLGALALLVAHGLNAYLTLWGVIPFATGMLFYLCIVVATIVIGRIFYMRDRERRGIVLLCMTTIVTGPFGAAGTLVMLLLYAWHSRFAQSFALWFETIFPSHNYRIPERIYENILIGRDEAAKSYSVIPFMEVLAYGNEMQKMQALSRMTSQFSPAFAPAFKRALNDSSNMVRVQAATAISKIENQFLEELMRLTTLYRQNPRDRAAVLALAEHYDDYAFIGILDADREGVNRERAQAHYLEYLKLEPGDTEVRARLGRLFLRNGEPQRASDWLTASVEEGYQSDAISLWLGEALFAARRFTDLREQAKRVAMRAETLRDVQPQVAEAYAFWNQQMRSA